MIKRPPINYLERKKILGTKIKAIRKSKKLTQPAFGLMINNGQLIDKKLSTNGKREPIYQYQSDYPELLIWEI
ncbi:hypothetical protein EFM1CSP_02200 [Enterococcus faecium]|nr:hypothetical protein EFM1CSP_02200 [Enterococcus faecium]BDP79856.1 hypothetical protein EfmAA290_05320 [Enterococcus faecium]